MTARSLETGAIGCRPAKRAPLWPLLLLSLALHAAVALGLTAVLSRHFFVEKRDDTPDPGIDVTFGDAVQEAVVAAPILEPPALPPPVPEPVPLPPEPAPMPMEKPDWSEPNPAPKRPRPRAPAEAKTGSVPRAGAIGTTTGAPGGQQNGGQGWRTPTPPYPRAALAAHIQGSGEVRITTDAAGHVREAVITRTISPILDANTRSFARENWKGPPNATRTVPVIYRIP